MSDAIMARLDELVRLVKDVRHDLGARLDAIERAGHREAEPADDVMRRPLRTVEDMAARIDRIHETIPINLPSDGAIHRALHQQIMLLRERVERLEARRNPAH